MLNCKPEMTRSGPNILDDIFQHTHTHTHTTKCLTQADRLTWFVTGPKAAARSHRRHGPLRRPEQPARRGRGRPWGGGVRRPVVRRPDWPGHRLQDVHSRVSGSISLFLFFSFSLFLFFAFSLFLLFSFPLSYFLFFLSPFSLSLSLSLSRFLPLSLIFFLSLFFL